MGAPPSVHGGGGGAISGAAPILQGQTEDIATLKQQVAALLRTVTTLQELLVREQGERARIETILNAAGLSSFTCMPGSGGAGAASSSGGALFNGHTSGRSSFSGYGGGGGSAAGYSMGADMSSGFGGGSFSHGGNPGHSSSVVNGGGHSLVYNSSHAHGENEVGGASSSNGDNLGYGGGGSHVPTPAQSSEVGHGTAGGGLGGVAHSDADKSQFVFKAAPGTFSSRLFGVSHVPNIDSSFQGASGYRFTHHQHQQGTGPHFAQGQSAPEQPGPLGPPPMKASSRPIHTSQHFPMGPMAGPMPPIQTLTLSASGH